MTTAQANQPKSSLRRSLSSDLSNRLRDDPDSLELPLIVENRIAQTRSVHLLVIWDRWNDIPNRERARIITDAFATAHPGDPATVTVPMGLTPMEAITLGFLPYRIVPLVRKSDKLSDRTILDAMRSVGGVYIQVGAERQLRFATQAQAEEAYRALATKVPSPVWTLVHEMSTAESA